MRKSKFIICCIVISIIIASITGCGKDSVQPQTEDTTKTETIIIAAAASLEHSMTDYIIPLFEKKYPEIKVEGTYDSSGKLKTQIEEGAPIDLFISAGEKQMVELVQEQKIDKDSVINWLENHMVLIVPAKNNKKVTSFGTLLKAETIAIGDPESVPAGQYAKDILESLGIWEQVLEKASLGTNVTEVLNWVAKKSAEAGIVYATDAMQTDQVKVLEKAPEGNGSKAIYPMGLTMEGSKKAGAKKFEEFLKTKEVLKIMKENGFTPIS